MFHWLWGEGQRRGLHPNPGTAPHALRGQMATSASRCQVKLTPRCPVPARAWEPALGWWGKGVERWQLGVPPALAVCQMSSKPTSVVPSQGIRGFGVPSVGVQVGDRRPLLPPCAPPGQEAVPQGQQHGHLAAPLHKAHLLLLSPPWPPHAVAEDLGRGALDGCPHGQGGTTAGAGMSPR